jgi:hypothetical protein
VEADIASGEVERDNLFRKIWLAEPNFPEKTRKVPCCAAAGEISYSLGHMPGLQSTAQVL